MQKSHRNQVKIKLYGKHFAWVNIKLRDKIDEILDGPIKRNEWIINQAKIDFNLDVRTVEDIEKLDNYLEENYETLYYDDKADWLRTKARNLILELEKKR